MEVTSMRKQCEQILKNLFYEKLIYTRHKLGYTQEDMAEILKMDVRSYVELDHGCSKCSALTLCLFLIYCYDEPYIFLNELKTSIESRTGYVA